MVRFGKKETTDKRQLLASMDSMHRYGSTKLDNALLIVAFVAAGLPSPTIRKNHPAGVLTYDPFPMLQGYTGHGWKAAFQHVRENLTDLDGRPEANETDLVFLQGILANPAVTQLIKTSSGRKKNIKPPRTGTAPSYIVTIVLREESV
uniref:Uncharacterized protein n=1 Tax=Anopheles culicifacies TaxID=139723 RepID=A0A182MV96_9DIPT